MEKTLPNKAIIEKLTKKRERFGLLDNCQQAETLNKPQP
jgi:hypothetical protein